MANQRGRKFETPQESFWAGEFSDQYVLRNQSETLRASNIAHGNLVKDQHGNPTKGNYDNE